MQNYRDNRNRFQNRSDNWGNRQGRPNNGPRKSRSVKNLMDINNFDSPFGLYDMDVERERNSRKKARWNERQERAASLPPQNHRIYNNSGTNDENHRSSYDRSKFRAQRNRKMSLSPQRMKQNTPNFNEGSCSEAQSFLRSNAENSLRSKNNMLAEAEFIKKLEDSGDNEQSSHATGKLAVEPIPVFTNDSIDEEIAVEPIPVFTNDSIDEEIAIEPILDFTNDSIDEELGRHGIASEVALICNACRVICLNDDEALHHIKTRSHKVNLKKLLKKVTNIDVVTPGDRRRACKIASTDSRFFSHEQTEHASTSDDE